MKSGRLIELHDAKKNPISNLVFILWFEIL